MSDSKRVLLIVAGGIAAYKSLELIRFLGARGIAVRCVLTKSGEEFVTPLSLAALSNDKVYTQLFSLTDESEMGHIQLSRSADLIVVAPATADILAKMRAGLADDLATTALLATDKPVMVAPAMNVRMWEHKATQENLRVLAERGIIVVGPDEGPMACNEFGMGRMAEPAYIAEAVEDFFGAHQRLKGKRALVTSGPTFEAIDPVRYLANHSSGKQGHAVARALAAAGAETILVSGPTQLADPAGVTVRNVRSADEMLAACQAALPADIVVCAAAVADWKIKNAATQKIKKNGPGHKNGGTPVLELAENPDILATLSRANAQRAPLIVGFAAETEKVVEQAIEKRRAKGCDWIVANDVSPGTGTFGGDANTVHVIDAAGVENWPRLDKDEVARRLTLRIADHFKKAEV
jgi:phosphopantothenoylcysteine decarboxylase/phosphopantothenate--cysteine ligase